MKFKLFMLTSFTIFACKTVFAQEIKLGAKVGGNYSTLKSDLDGEDYKLGFHVGGLAEFKFNEKFSIQPELLYSMEGAKTDGSYKFVDEGVSYNVNYKEDIELAYLQLPIMFRYKLVDKLSLEVGPQIGYLLSAKTDYEIKLKAEGETFTETGSEKIKDQLKSVDYGVNFGLGYEFGNNMFVQGRYHLGIADIDNSKTKVDEQSFDKGKILSRGLQLSVGYKF